MTHGETKEAPTLLSDEVEDALTNGILDEKCAPDFADTLRDLLLKQFADLSTRKIETGQCPDCNGRGVVQSGLYEDGCDLCAGAGQVHTIVVPGPPLTSAHTRRKALLAPR